MDLLLGLIVTPFCTVVSWYLGFVEGFWDSQHRRSLHRGSWSRASTTYEKWLKAFSRLRELNSGFSGGSMAPSLVLNSRMREYLNSPMGRRTLDWLLWRDKGLTQEAFLDYWLSPFPADVNPQVREDLAKSLEIWWAHSQG
jgi:hypothetical protein